MNKAKTLLTKYSQIRYAIIFRQIIFLVLVGYVLDYYSSSTLVGLQDIFAWPGNEYPSGTGTSTVGNSMALGRKLAGSQ